MLSINLSFDTLGHITQRFMVATTVTSRSASSSRRARRRRNGARPWQRSIKMAKDIGVETTGREMWLEVGFKESMLNEPAADLSTG